jgi:spore photoproduct lyase
MSKSEYFPQKVFIEKGSFDFPLTKRILKNVGPVPSEVIDDPQELLEDIEASKDAIGAGKKYLLITRQKGEFVKPCPCTPGYLGCNYFIINIDLNCPLDCSYCILQHYLTNPLITAHVNLEDLWRQLDIFLHSQRQRKIRIGTGELGDSLALDHLTENSMDLVSYFREKTNVVFELKTKTVNIKNILKIEPAPNVVVAWSLNSLRIAKEEEKGAPPIEERIDAARRVLERGFHVAFHFDPIIRHPDWEEGYKEVIKKLLATIDSVRIAWISLGSLRFPASLKAIIEERFPRTKIIYDEFIKGKDGKLRYFKPLRLELYKKIIGFIKEWGGEKIPLYFCMESEDIWRQALGWVPKGKEDLEAYLSSPPGLTNDVINSFC